LALVGPAVLLVAPARFAMTMFVLAGRTLGVLLLA
jgi:hypothetical protein